MKKTGAVSSRRKLLLISILVVALTMATLLTMTLGSPSLARASWPDPAPHTANTDQAGKVLPEAANSGLPEASVGTSAVLTAAIKYEPDGLDPSLNFGSSWLVTSQIYETLVKAALGNILEQPSIAYSWTVSADGLIWTFDIRPGIKFHDNTDLDANAVALNLARWWDPDHPYHDGDFIFFENLFGYKGDPNSLITGITAPGPSQLQITLSRPSSDLLARLSSPALAIASPTAIQAGTLMTTPIGSGPFQFADWTPAAEIELVAYPQYWKGLPHLDGLVFRVVSDDSDRFAAVQSGTAHTAHDLLSDFANAAASDDSLNAVWHPPTSIGYLGINQAHSPLDDPLVRQAISHAINKDALIGNHFTPGDLPADQLLPPSVWGRDPDLLDNEYNPTLASELLSQAGYPNGFATTLAIRDVWRVYLPDPVGAAMAIQQDLLAVGIGAEIIVYDSSEFIDRFYNGQLDLFLLGWIADYAHPDDFFAFHLCSSGTAFGPNDEELCNQLEIARGNNDFANRLAIYRWVSSKVKETIPLVPLSHARDLFVARTSITTPELTPSGNAVLYNVTETVRIGTQVPYSPFEYFSGTQLVGFDIDLMDAAAQEAGFTHEYVLVEWSLIFDALVNDDVDALISALTITPGREEIVDFTLPYLAYEEPDGGTSDIGIAVQQGNSQLRHQMNSALWQLLADGMIENLIDNYFEPGSGVTLPSWPTLDPGTETRSVYTDTLGNPTIIEASAGAVTESIVLEYTPVDNIAVPSGFSVVGQMFELDAYDQGQFIEAGYSFAAPVTITVHYSNSQIIGLDENSLLIERWDEDAQMWVDAACGLYDRHLEENWLAVPICHLSRFALVGQEYAVYLPLITDK